jgi:hypothetical protein
MSIVIPRFRAAVHPSAAPCAFFHLRTYLYRSRLFSSIFLLLLPPIILHYAGATLVLAPHLISLSLVDLPTYHTFVRELRSLQWASARGLAFDLL